MKTSFFFKALAYAFVLIMILTTVACECDSATMHDNTWVLTQYGSNNATTAVIDPSTIDPPGGGEITLRFDDGNVNGNDGCNLYFGTYSQNNCNLSIGNLSTTLIYCFPPIIMTQASTYKNILVDVQTFSTANNQLKLCTSDDRVLIFEKQ